MKTTFLMMTVLFTIASALPRFVRQETPIPSEEIVLDEVVQAARGFFQGFQGGLYKTDKVEEGCLNKEAEAKIIELFEAVFSGKMDLTFVMRVVTDFITISSNLEQCSMKSFTDLASFCFFNKDGTKCAPNKLMENVQKNLLLILAKLTDISTLVFQGIPKDNEAAFAMGQQAGGDIGNLVRIVLDFKLE